MFNLRLGHKHGSAVVCIVANESNASVISGTTSTGALESRLVNPLLNRELRISRQCVNDRGSVKIRKLDYSVRKRALCESRELGMPAIVGIYAVADKYTHVWRG